jgi:hypothetical protein
MAWLKKGLIYAPKGQYGWNKTHASVPTVDVVNDRVWRIYFAARDAENRSHTSYLEVEAGNPGNVLYEHPEPILPLGRIGTFDDCGVMPSWVVNNGSDKYLYYVGWTVRQTVPFHNSIGLAISKDGGASFERFSEGPLFGSTYQEPYFSGTSCVLVEEGLWKNWYLSCTKWEVIDGRPEPFYHLKYAESTDGVNWRREGKVAIDFKSPDEAGIVKASVLKEDNYKMWFSYRPATKYRVSKRNGYRIGYAESPDGVQWTRMDDRSGIDVSNEGWDSEMIEYPHVIKNNGRLYLFYNGNGFGHSGFGYATSGESNE